MTLEEHGFLIATVGKNGGVCLAKEPKDITLWDVYLAVETNDVEEIFKLHETDSDCPVGKNIFQLLYLHMLDAVTAMKDSMDQVTLETLVDELKLLLKDIQAENHTQSHAEPQDGAL